MKKSPLMAGKAGIAKKAAQLQVALQFVQSVVPNLKSTVQQLRKENTDLRGLTDDYAAELLENQAQRESLLASVEFAKKAITKLTERNQDAEQRIDLQAHTNIDLREKLSSVESDLWVANRKARMCKTQCTQLEEALRGTHADIQNLTTANGVALRSLSFVSAIATFAVVTVVVLIGQLIYVA